MAVAGRTILLTLTCVLQFMVLHPDLVFDGGRLDFLDTPEAMRRFTVTQSSDDDDDDDDTEDENRLPRILRQQSMPASLVSDVPLAPDGSRLVPDDTAMRRASARPQGNDIGEEA